MRRNIALMLATVLVAAVMLPVLAVTPARADSWDGIAAGGIVGDYNNPQAQAACSAVYNGILYIGTRSVSGCEVWSFDGGTWTSIAGAGFGDDNNRAVTAMATFDGKLYAGTYNQSGSCELWSYDGTGWTRVSGPLLEIPHNSYVSALADFSGTLVVGTANDDGCNVLTFDGSTWMAQTSNGFGNANNDAASSMAVYGDELYVGTWNIVGACEVHKWTGAAWSAEVGGGGAVPAGFGDPNNQDASAMTVYTDGTEKLWVGTRNNTDGAEVWYLDPTGIPFWAMGAPPGTFDANCKCVTSLCSYDNGSDLVLYAGMENQTDGCEVYRYLAGWSNDIGSGTAEHSHGFGDPSNQSVISMVVYNGGLVAGTSQGLYNPPSGCQVWDLASEGTWSQINDNGFAPNAQVAVTCTATIGNAIYFGTYNASTGARLWRYDGGWEEMVIPGFSYHNSAILCMLAEGNNLWIGTRNPATGGEVWLYDGAWHMKIGPPGGAGDISLGPDNPQVSSMALLSGKLWIGTLNQNGCEIWYNDSPGNWGQSADHGISDATNVDASSMRVYGGGLFVGTWRGNGCCVYRYSPGTSWVQLVGPAGATGPGFGNDRNLQAASCAIWNSKLYFGTYNTTTGCEVWGYDGTTWSRSVNAGWGDHNNQIAISMAVLGGRFYVGTMKYPNGPDGGEVWMANSTGWNQVNADGFGNHENNGVMALGVLGTALYAGTYNVNTGFEVYHGVATPTIDSIAPGTARGGDVVTLAGVNFGTSQGGSYVSLGSGPVQEYTFWSDNQVKFKVPPGVGGKLPVSLTTSLGTSNIKTLTVRTPTWYLAEGSSDWGFDCYIVIENPNSSAVTTKVTYMTPDGPVTRPNLTLPAASQTTINPRDDIGARDFSTKVECVEGKDIAVDRRMMWTGSGAASPEGHSSIGVTSPAKVWYLPEGSSKWGFECWLLIQNPNNVQATCQITYMVEGGAPFTVTRTIDENSRQSFDMYGDVGAVDASIMVSSDQPVIPERAMYRNNRREGHDSVGTVSPANACYLAEGTTGWGFTTYVLVQNPNTTEASVVLNYMTADGPQPQPAFTLPGKSRKTIRVNDVMQGKDFSTLVAANKPVIAERAMYWDNGTGEACHDSIGMSGPHKTFYLPDGETYNGHETFTLVQNPNMSPVTIEVKYLTNGETPNIVFTDVLQPNSRKTYNMGEKIPAGKAAVVVTSKTAGKKIMVERSMYWNARGAGTDTIGGCTD